MSIIFFLYFFESFLYRYIFFKHISVLFLKVDDLHGSMTYSNNNSIRNY